MAVNPSVTPGAKKPTEATQPNAPAQQTQQQQLNNAWVQQAANKSMSNAAQQINAAMQAQPSAQTQQDATTTQEAKGGVYKVGDNGQAPKGLKVGDQVVTGGGTYTITGVNADGSYTSKLTNADQKTSNYTGQYSQLGGAATPTAQSPQQPSFAAKYDPNVNYDNEIKKALAAGDLQAVAILEQARNAKIDALGLGNKYAKTSDYAQYLAGIDPARAAQLTGGYAEAPIKFPDNPSDKMRELVDQMTQVGIDRQNAQIDYAVQQTENEYNRAVEDAQPEFDKRLKQLDIDTARALANSAMYAEMRGDRGGIGQSQYNEVQAQALANKQQIKAEQTKLATDAARAIADARSKGEFEKADALKEWTQNQLSQLYEIEKFNAEFGMSKAEFEQSIAQWKANFALQESAYTGMYKGQPTLSAKNDERDYTAALAEMKLKQFGVMPTAAELAALNMTEADAQRVLWNLGFGTGNFSSGGSGSGSGGSWSSNPSPGYTPPSKNPTPTTPQTDLSSWAKGNLDYLETQHGESQGTGRRPTPEKRLT